MSSITIDKLVKIYDNGYQAVKGIDLAVKEHEFMVLVGPSGCGKTTTLRMIAGLEEISSGEIRIANRRINEVAPKNRDIAMVFQSYALYPHMTVYENMAFALRLRKTSEKDIHSKVIAASDMLSLGSQLEKLPKELSGGQRQRVALGRAIVRQPKAFLFDEPLSNLDAKLRGEMRYELRSLQNRLQTTSVYVTHDQIEAMTLGDRITVMSVGDIQQVADPKTIYEHPYNRFVAAFMGTPPMNFIDGSVGQSGGRWQFSAEGCTPVALAFEHQNRLGEAAAQCTLGVRPENLHTKVTAPAGSPSLPMLVDVVEHMGDHQYVYLKTPGASEALIMKGPSTIQVARGEQIDIFIDTPRCHLFKDRSEHADCLTLPPGFPRQQG